MKIAIVFHKNPFAPPASIDLIRLRSISKELMHKGIETEIIAPVEKEGFIDGVVPVCHLRALKSGRFSRKPCSGEYRRPLWRRPAGTGRPYTMWDSPYTRTFKMMYQSLELLHYDQHFDCFHSFFLYPTGYIAGLIARKTGKPSIVTIVGNDVRKYKTSEGRVKACCLALDVHHSP